MELIMCPIMWFPNRPNEIQAGVLLTLPSFFSHSELTATFQELDISFPTNQRLLLHFILLLPSERAIPLPNPLCDYVFIGYLQIHFPSLFNIIWVVWSKDMGLSVLGSCLS